MEETELKSIIANEIANSLGIDGSALADERLRLQQYYEGLLPRGNGIADRSQLKDRAVLEVINWLMPDLIRVFMSSDKIVSFEPRRPQDIGLAQQITEYANYILREDNDGFRIIYEAIKTCLVQKNSFIKVSFEPQVQCTMNSYSGLTEGEYQQLLAELKQADRYEIKDENAYPDPTASPFPLTPPQGISSPMLGNGSGQLGNGSGQLSQLGSIPLPPQLHDLRVRVWNSEGRVVIRHVLPEDVLISRRMPSTKFNGDYFVGYRARKTISDLRVLGYPDDLIEAARGDDAPEWNAERVSRFSKDEDYQYDTRSDEAMVPVWITEVFMKCDWDNDGIAELRRIVVAREGAIIFENEEVDEVPLINLTPIIEPGRAVGMSIAELCTDLQETKTAMVRGVMDSLYLSLVPRNIVNINKLTEDTFDDINEGSPGSNIRVADDGAVTPISVPFVGQQALGVMEFINQQVQTRTGVGPQNNIISPDVLNNQTAAGISMTQSAASAQIELICRVIAETGFRELARHILGLVVRHQDKPRMIRVNGSFVPMDPRFWHEDFDLSISVGLGTGSKEKTTRDLMSVLQIMQPIVEQQKGLQGPYVTSQDLHTVLNKLTTAMGYREDFFPHLQQPQPGPPGQQPQNPDIMKAQIAQAQAQQDLQMTQQKAQIEARLAADKHMAEMQRDAEKHAAEMQRDSERANHQMQIELQRERSKQQLQQQQLQAQMAMDIQK